jgi:hypothetical protein
VDDEICITFANVTTSHATHLNSAPGEVFEYLSYTIQSEISGMTTDENNQILIYQSDDGNTHIEVKFTGDSVWLTQQQLCNLYKTSKSNVSEHIKHIFEDGELDREAVVRKFRSTASDGKNYEMVYYNLDMIISLGYRIK